MDSNIQKAIENNNLFIKQRSSLLPSLVPFILAAAAALALKLVHTSSNESETPIIFITAILAFTAWGAFSVLTRKTLFVHQPSNQKLIFKTINIDLNDKDMTKQLLSDGNISILKSLRTSEKDALQLHIAFTPDNSVFMAQLSVYVPYEYVNASAVVSFPAEKAAAIRAHFVDKK